FTLNATGTYRLVIEGESDTTGPFRFRHLDVAAATTVAPGQSFSGVLDTGLEGRLFQIQGVAGQKLDFLPEPDLFLRTADVLSEATGSLVSLGRHEDGYQAIHTALSPDAFRPGAAINVVLITDEDRDIFDHSLDFASIAGALEGKNALLN